MKLRELVFDDAGALLAWLQDERVNRWLDGDMNSLTSADMENFICGAVLLAEDTQRVISDNEGRFWGLASLKNISQRQHSAELALGLAPEVWGRGWAAQAADELLAYGFRQLSLEYVYGCVNKGNTAALKFCQKYGMREMAAPPGEAMLLGEYLRWFIMEKADFELQRCRD